MGSAAALTAGSSGVPGHDARAGDPSGSRPSLKDALQSCKDLHKWTVPMLAAGDIEPCRSPDGSPIELGRGGFCKASPRPALIADILVAARMHAGPMRLLAPQPFQALVRGCGGAHAACGAGQDAQSPHASPCRMTARC